MIISPEEYEAQILAASESELHSENLGRQIKKSIRATQVLARQVIVDLQAEKARAQSIIDKTNAQITPGDTKDLARSCKRIADATIDFARLVVAMGRSADDPLPPME